MSRVDQAWRRTAGAATAWDEPSSVVAEPGEALLQRYPGEGPAGTVLPVLEMSRGGVAAPAPISLPLRSERPAPPRFHESLNRLLVVSGQAGHVAIEQYRRLAGVVHDLQREQGLSTLMVTSALPGEGKTLTITNLALTLSEACSRRVLLIDGDLRRPSIHKVFRVPNAQGLSDVLSGARAGLPFVDVSEFLTILPAGQLDQPMALTSDRMRAVLEQCQSRFEWVLIDAPPVGLMPDAQLLARLARAVLFVIAANSTPHPLVTRAVSELGVETIVGTILNRVDEELIPAADYFDSYYSSPVAGV